MSGHKKYLSVALLSAVLLPAMASAADAPATFTPEQEAKIGKIAADYLVAHPEVLLQASQKLQQIQAEQQASAATQAVLKNAAVLTQDKNTPTYGPANGKVTVIEFFDYQCVYCSRLAPVMEQVIKAHPQTRFAFKEWPIFGGRWESSLEAAKTGLQIYQQKGADAYLAYHNGIYATVSSNSQVSACGWCGSIIPKPTISVSSSSDTPVRRHNSVMVNVTVTVAIRLSPMSYADRSWLRRRPIVARAHALFHLVLAASLF